MPVEAVIPVDGLDGSGKGSCGEKIAAFLDGPTILIDYPQYDLPWGQVLRHLLWESDEGLSIRDRMLVYALNRLETVETIRAQVATYTEQGKPVNLVFDRFYSSNVITAAYYLAKMEQDERPPDIRSWISELFHYMQEIDSIFLEELELMNATVFIPMLDDEDPILGVLTDTTRIGADLYETSDVQKIARELYILLGEMYPNQLRIFAQTHEGVRMSPAEQAEHIVRLAGLEPVQSDLEPIVYKASATPQNIDALNILLNKYGSEDLQRFNPYKHLEMEGESTRKPDYSLEP